MNNERKYRGTFDLTADDFETLRQIAERHKCVSVSGPLVGRGSPQPLIEAIVAGRLLVVENPSYNGTVNST